MKKIGILIIPLLLVISSTGCIDVYLIKDVLNKIEGEEEIIYVWREKLNVEDNFEITLNGSTPTLQDMERIINKIYENVTKGNVNNFQKILQEENIVFKKDIYDFFVIKGTRTLTLEITATWEGWLVGTQGFGYFEITVRHEGKIVLEESYPSTEKEFTKTIPLSANPGNWSVEIGGTGGPGLLINAYKGQYELLVKAYEPK